MASIVAANVLTLFNAIIGGFFILILSLGLLADALFGLIAIVNSAIGIRQELKAKETLDRLALLVAPRAKAIRDGRVVELTSTRSCPATWSGSSRATSSSPTATLVDTRGLTVDESLLTGESDGIRKRIGDRMLSGSFGLSGSGTTSVDAVREDSYAEKIAGEAREFRHAALAAAGRGQHGAQGDDDRARPDRADRPASASRSRTTRSDDAAQEATAGLVTLIPEGLVLLMSVTLAVAAVRLARQNTLVQQMAATEALAAVDTICVDKTGTLTDGDAEAGRGRGRRPGGARPRAERALATFAASAGERNRTLETIAERYPAHPEQPPPRSRSPRSGNGAG